MPDRVLLVDDDCSLLRALRRTLYEQFDVATASSGANALECFRNEGPFDCVVTDLNMPQMDGIELVRQIGEHNSQTPCIILTGNQDEASLDRAKQSGLSVLYLNKPVTKQELISAIKQVIHQVAETL